MIEESGLKQRPRRDDYNSIHRALLTGLLSNVAFRTDTNEYTVAGGNKVFLWPGSGVLAKKPKWIVAAELVETTKRYLRTAARIDPGWIEPLAAHLVSRSYSEPHWEPSRNAAVAFEKVSLFGLTIVPRRNVPYGPIDPAKSRELFLQHGLVEGAFETSGEFFRFNRELLEEVESLQTKTRQPGYLRGEEARFEFYDQRIPADVYDGPRFEKWRRVAEQENPRLLYMTRSDLIEEQEAEVAAADFPDTLSIRQMQLPLEYRFEPGSAGDGVTLTVPKEGLNQLDVNRLGWLVPGLLEEKIVALIKSLPKDLRRRFVPATDTAKEILKQIRFGEGAFPVVVAKALSEFAGERIPAEQFQQVGLPSHLQMNIRVVDDAGEALTTGRDVSEIRRQLGMEAAQSFAAASPAEWNRDELTAWDFGNLPAQIELERGGVLLKGFPALIDRGEAVSLRLLDSPEAAARETRAGVRRLFVRSVPRELKAQVNWLPNLDQILLHAATLSDFKNLKPQLGELIADRAFFADERLPRTAAEFTQRAAAAKGRIGLAVQDVGTLLLPLMQAYHQARLAVERTQTPLWKPVLDDLRTQLAQLTAPGFLTSTPWAWLLHYPRFFRAIPLRLQKLAGPGFARDQSRQADVAARWARYVERLQQQQSQGILDPELALYRWMLEEYRVSLFAQELGTSLAVSDKRLDKQWAKVSP
jgi:ATP-dependent helicase HrpA